MCFLRRGTQLRLSSVTQKTGSGLAKHSLAHGRRISDKTHPIRTSLEVAQHGFYLGPHAAGTEVAVGQQLSCLCKVQGLEPTLFWCSEMDGNLFDTGRD